MQFKLEQNTARPNDTAYESNPDLRIKFVQSGGLAVVCRELILDTNTLSLHESKMLHTLIENSGFHNLSHCSPIVKKGADYFEYQITIESEGEMQTVKTTYLTMPPTLVP
jgi:hypothetical protein